MKSPMLIAWAASHLLRQVPARRAWCCTMNAEAVAAETRRDPVLSQVLRLVQQDGWLVESPDSLKPYGARRHELSQTVRAPLSVIPAS